MLAHESVGSSFDDVKADASSDHDEDVFASVANCIKHSWKPLPFSRATGICYLDADSATQFTCSDDPVEIAEKFTGYDVGINVGASGLVDLDIDCAEAVPFVDVFLPPTRTIGRPGKPCSHKLIRRCPGDADHESAVSHIHKRRFGTGGQRCLFALQK